MTTQREESPMSIMRHKAQGAWRKAIGEMILLPYTLSPKPFALGIHLIPRPV